MKTSLSEKGNSKTATYAGYGLAVGATLGMICGLMLSENLVLGCAIGATLGLGVAAAVDTQDRR
jgi:flagellar biosynthesis protein FliR